MDAVSPVIPKSLNWYEVWHDVLLHPSEKTFESILEDPTASPRRVYIWTAIVGLLGGILQAFIKAFFMPDVIIILQICTAIASPVSAVISLVIVAAYLHWISSSVKGRELMHGWCMQLARL